MSCRRYRRRLALLAGGDLGSREARRVRKHLEGCEACRSLLAELESDRSRLSSLASALSGESGENNLRTRVLDAWSRENAGEQPELAKPTTFRILGLPARAAVAAIALVALAILVSWILVAPRSTAVRSADNAGRPEARGTSPRTLPEGQEARAQGARAQSETSSPGLEASVVAPRPVPQASRSVSKPPVRANEEAQVTKFTVKLETGDPKVVIYWVIETKKGATSS